MASSLCSPKGPRVSFIHQLHQHLQPMKPWLLGSPWQGPRHWEPKAGDIGRGPVVEALTTCHGDSRDGGKPMAFPWKMIPMLANSQPKQWFLLASEFPGKSCFVQVWKWKWRFHQHQCLFDQENWWLNMVEPWWTYILLKYNKHIETIGSQPVQKKKAVGAPGHNLVDSLSPIQR